MNKHQILIAPSILSADLGHLQNDVASIENAADWLQVDVMDGHFVPNLSFGAPVVKCIQTKLPLDIHLMVSNPADRIEEFLALNVSHITFHAEAVTDSEERRALISGIHEEGATAGIALKPATPVSDINDVIDDIDLVLIMSVEPGFGGQAFMPEVLEKVKEIRAAHPNLMIQMDGGINAETAKQCIEAGANNLVAGSFVFKAKNREETIRSLRA
jgi:ribulose-phosphate 3-epimerase